MFQKMSIAILLLVIGVINGSTRPNRNALEQRVKEMGERTSHMGEHMEEKLQESEAKFAEKQREREAHWKKINSEIKEKFQNKQPEKGFYLRIIGLDGRNGAIIRKNGSVTVTFEDVSFDGEYYFHQTVDDVIGELGYRTITDYNLETNQYETTTYTWNVNDQDPRVG